MKKRIIVGISGASGSALALDLLRVLHDREDVETHLIITRAGCRTMEIETDSSTDQAELLADYVWPENAFDAPVASGSFRTEGMIVVPCSMKTVAGIACGYAENLLLRAADVMLKERRTLVLCPRENPLSTIHLRNLHELSQMGAWIVPPVMTFYSGERSVEEMVRQVTGRLLMPFGIEVPGYRRWREN